MGKGNGSGCLGIFLLLEALGAAVIGAVWGFLWLLAYNTGLAFLAGFIVLIIIAVAFIIGGMS